MQTKKRMGRPPKMPDADNIICEIRRRTGWSQEDLAARLGVSRTAIAKHESGANGISAPVKMLAQQILDSLP